MKDLVFILAILSKTTCIHVKIEESHFIRPYKLTQYKASEVFTQQALDKIPSNAALKEVRLAFDTQQN
nr:hypothetical protein [uncultured Undibacterium sp.]